MCPQKKTRESFSQKEERRIPENDSFLQIRPGPHQSSDAMLPPWREEFLGPDRPGGMSGPLVFWLFRRIRWSKIVDKNIAMD